MQVGDCPVDNRSAVEQREKFSRCVAGFVGPSCQCSHGGLGTARMPGKCTKLRPESHIGRSSTTGTYATARPVSGAGGDEWFVATEISVRGFVGCLYVLADPTARADLVPVLACPGANVLQVDLATSGRRSSTGLPSAATGNLLGVLDPESQLFMQFVRMFEIQIDAVLVSADAEFDGFTLPIFDNRSVDIVDHLHKRLACHLLPLTRLGDVIFKFYHRFSYRRKELNTFRDVSNQ